MANQAISEQERIYREIWRTFQPFERDWIRGQEMASDLDSCIEGASKKLALAAHKEYAVIADEIRAAVKRLEQMADRWSNGAHDRMH